MARADDFLRRIEALEAHHSGIGSEVAVVKAEVGTMQRDINFLRTSVDNVGLKLDAVLQSVTTIQTQNSLRRTRDPVELWQRLSSIVVAAFVIGASLVGVMTYVSKSSLSEDTVQAAVAKAIAGQHRMMPPTRRE